MGAARWRSLALCGWVGLMGLIGLNSGVGSFGKVGLIGGMGSGFDTCLLLGEGSPANFVMPGLGEGMLFEHFFVSFYSTGVGWEGGGFAKSSALGTKIMAFDLWGLARWRSLALVGAWG